MNICDCRNLLQGNDVVLEEGILVGKQILWRTYKHRDSVRHILKKKIVEYYGRKLCVSIVYESRTSVCRVAQPV